MDEEQKIPQSGNPPNDELAKCAQERDEYLNGWKRAKADLINYKNEESRRTSDLLATMAGMLVKDLLPVLDSFELALVSVKDNQPAFEGVTMIQSQLMEVLKRRGLTKIEVKIGDNLDTRLHEPVGEVELDLANPEVAGLAGKVAELLSSGYLTGDKVLRPAKVKIGKSKN